MLACARLGLIHSVVFAGFSAQALRSRIDDAQARVVITADGQYRRGTPVALKADVDDAITDTTIEHVLVVRRTGIDVTMVAGRDHWWDETVAHESDHHECLGFDAEAPLFVLYTSGTTGQSKGIVHTMGGYLTQTSFTHRECFDLNPETDVYWCGADIGWITGHSYLVYGPLCNGATQVVYEGTPNSPNEHRHFEIIEKYGVTIYYIAPTLVRTFMKWGRSFPDSHDLSSIRVLASVGEPINPEAWHWLSDVIGGGRAPIVDTWWQTETGAHMIAPLAGTAPLVPGSAQRAIPGVSVKVVDDAGTVLPRGEQGLLVVDRPWPSMARGIWGDVERFRTCTGAGSLIADGISLVTVRVSTMTEIYGFWAASTM